MELSGVFKIDVDVKNGVETNKVEAVIKEELGKLAEKGPTLEELKRVKIQYQADFIKSAEKLGGGKGKAQILASSEILARNPNLIKKNMETILNASIDDIQEVTVKWLSDGAFIQIVQPGSGFKASELKFDRSRMPEPGEPPIAKLPELQRITLSNGLKVILVERPGVPLVRFNLLVNAGFVCDKFASIGTSRLTGAMVNEGTKTRTSQQISEELEALGATLATGGNLDFLSISMTALKKNLDKSLEILADVILNPSFPADRFEGNKERYRARIAREESGNITLALRILPGILYGKNHIYGIPFSGLLNKKSIAALKLEDVKKFHKTLFKANNSTLIIVGDITKEEIVYKIEAPLKSWSPGDVPILSIDNVQQREKPAIYLVDRPNSTQSGIAVAQLLVPKKNNMDNAISIAHSVLAGSSTKSRIGKNLREDKHWTYMAFSMIVPTRGQRYYVIYTPIQVDRTADSMIQIKKEMQEFIGNNPISGRELIDAKKATILSLTGEFETGSDILNKIIPIVRYDLPDDYYENYAAKINALTIDDVTAAARAIFRPDDLVWIVIGDRDKIEEEIKKLGFGEVIPIDLEGNPIK